MKNSYFALSREQQRRVVEQGAVKHNLPKHAIEKDLWVSAMLHIIFSLPCARSLVFKGGTSLSKVWNLIHRFSEDIDLAIDRAMFSFEGDLTKKQVKSLRKVSSIFVRDTLVKQLNDSISGSPLSQLCEIQAQADGVGDITYPEPRIIYVKYKSVFDDRLSYIEPEIKIEAGSRSLLEPTVDVSISSLIETAIPSISTTMAITSVKTAVPEKTFLEKAFLLHELFSVCDNVPARRRSRHIYDLSMMIKGGVAEKAISNDELWETISYHRSTLTGIQGVDYTPDIRNRIQLVPPHQSLENWQYDYDEMSGAMIYNNPPSFAQLVESMRSLEQMFRNRDR